MLGTAYLQGQQTNRAVELFTTAMGRPEIGFNESAAVAQYFAQIGDYNNLETAVRKMVSIAPTQPEPRYDLAALQAIKGNTAEALQNLKAALDMSAQCQPPESVSA